jgi:hypothetical protein
MSIRLSVHPIVCHFAATERSFCHNIIPHLHETSVFMCVASGSSSPALTASISDAVDWRFVLFREWARAMLLASLVAKIKSVHNTVASKY